MKKAFSVPCILFFCCLLLSLSQAVTAQIATTNYTAPAAPQPRTQQAPLSRARKAAEFNAVRVLRLHNLTDVERQRTQEKKNFRIGIARHLPRPIESLNEFTVQAIIQGVPGTLYLLRLVSPEARALRVHFKALHLPDGARLFVSSRQDAQVFSPAYTNTRADFWTPSLPGDEVIIECFVPSQATMETSVAPFQIDAVNHIFRAARESSGAQPEAAGACNQEVPVEFREAAKATALIAFAKTDGEYVCSGTLLSDLKKTGMPYFLTANHCISNSGEASSAEVYWNYDSGSFPTTTPTRSARLLATDEADDYTLLELGSKPPGGVVYSGWTSVPQAVGTSVTGLHHPQADYKRAAFGKLVEAACPAEIPQEFCDFYAKVQWERGITEPGSSGSGIFIGTGNQTQLIGLLSGGESSCENQAGADFYGRLSRIFGALGFYLTNGELCRYTLLQDRFAYDAVGGNGEATVVPKLGGENCPWQAQSNVSWITLTNASGNGLGKVTFQVAANTSDKQRLGAITIAGRNVLVRQNPAAPNDPCAATSIDYGQTVTGDLRTSNCTSLFDPDPTAKAARYTFDAAAGQTVSFAFRQGIYNSQYRLIYPDGKVVFFRDAYPTILPVTGTYLIELALLPSEFTNSAPYNFFIVKNCQYKYSTNYVEVDAFGTAINPSTGNFPRIRMERVGDNCFNLFATADESGIDDNKIGAAPYDAAKQELILATNATTDTKLRYAVIRILDQPFIIKQIPRCSSATTFSYTPSELTSSSIGGTFQMQVKRTAGPSCSWEIKPYNVVENGHSETRDILIQPENYSNWARGTNEGEITYKVPINSYFRTRKYVLKDNDQVAQTITQPFLGETCARPVLQVGQSANGTLTTSDCNWYEAGQYVDVYQLNLALGEQYAVELSGTAGSEIAAELGILEYGSIGSIGDLKQKAVIRAPETGFGTAYIAGTYALRVFGKPGSYQIKLLGVGPAGCVYKINKEGDVLLPASTTSYPVELNCNRGDCDWTAQSSANWITFPNGVTGQGSQTVTLALAPNTGAKRQATVTIAGRTFSLTQDYSCSYRKYNLPAPNKFFTGYEGGAYRYYVETSLACPEPVMTPSADWIKAIAPPGRVIVTVAPNEGGFRKGTLTIAGEVFEVLQGGNDLVVTTAADYQRAVSPGSLVTVFNQGMTARTEAAQSLPLPNSLADTAVVLELPDGTTLLAPMLYASPNQINFYLPETVPPGRIKLRISSGAASFGGGSNLYASGEFEVANLAPNVFTADATGKGPAAADIQRIRPGQPVVYEPVATTVLDEQGKPMIVARPISIGTGDEKTYLVLYATGLRKRNANAAVTAQIGDVTLPVEYAGAQGQFVGLDQINIQLPPSLRGKGLVNVTVTMDGKATNPVQINIAP